MKKYLIFIFTLLLIFLINNTAYQNLSVNCIQVNLQNKNQKDNKKKSSKNNKSKNKDKNKSAKQAGTADTSSNNENDDTESDEQGPQETDQQYLTRSVWQKNYNKRINEIRDSANQDYNVTISKIQNFSQENDKIAQQIVRKFQDESQHMVNVLDESIQIVLKDLLDNHIAIMNFTELFVFSRFEYYDKKIEQTKIQIKDMLEYIEPPLSICENQVSCDYCTKIPSCIWCTDCQKCVPGNTVDGAYFQDCSFFMSQFCNRNAQAIDPESQMITPGTRIKERNPVLSNLVNPAQQQYMLEQQQLLIKQKDKIETLREKIKKLQIFYYKLKQSQILIQRQLKLMQQQQKLQEYVKEESLFGDGEVWDGETELEKDGEFWVDTLPSETEDEELEQLQEEIEQLKGQDYYQQQTQAQSQQNQQNNNLSKQQKQESGEYDSIEEENEARFERESNKDKLKQNGKQSKNVSKEEQEQQKISEDNLEYLNNHEGGDIELDLDEIEDEEQEILDFIAEDLYENE